MAESEKYSSPHSIAALLHIYLSTLTLQEISDRSGLSLDTLHNLRTKAPFMRLVDTLKKECSREFREDLLINDHHPEEYNSIAADFTMLDEMVQMQIKVPLFTQLRDLSQRLKSRKTFGLKLETHELMLFKRLFTFFIFVERYVQTLTSKALSEMKQIAEEIVLPALHIDINEIEQILRKSTLTLDSRVKELRLRLDNSFSS